MAHPELAAEQAYVDRAYDQLDHMRSTVARTQEAMATEWAALNMEAWVKRRMRTFEDAERGLVFGRLTLDGTPRPLYVGRRWVHDDEHVSLVVNWQAPAAPARRRSASTARPGSPTRIARRCGGCSSSGRTRPSWTTSRTSCRRSARRRSSSAR